MADHFSAVFTKSDSSNYKYQESGSRKTLASKDLKMRVLLTHIWARNLQEDLGVENLCSIVYNDLAKRLQDHAGEFMQVRGLKIASGIKQKDTSLEHWKLQRKNLLFGYKSNCIFI